MLRVLRGCLISFPGSSPSLKRVHSLPPWAGAQPMELDGVGRQLPSAKLSWRSCPNRSRDQAPFTCSPACLPLSFSSGTGSFPCTHGLRLSQTIPKTSCSVYSFLFCRAWDGTEGLMCAKKLLCFQVTFLSPTCSFWHHSAVKFLRLQCLLREALLVWFPGIPYLLSSFHCTFSDWCPVR